VISPAWRALAAGLVAVLVLPLVSGGPTRPAAAQEAAPPSAGEPPEVGAPVLEDPLTAPRVFGQPGACPNGRNPRDFVGEGSIIKVTGRCSDTTTSAGVTYRLNGLTVPDGDVRLEFKLVSGHERGRVTLYARARPTLTEGYYTAVVEPATGLAQLRRFADGQPTVLAERTDLAAILAPADWNSLAFRLRGPDLWLLLNDQPVLMASDPTFDSGILWAGLTRTGDPTDDQETAVVLRNLRVAALSVGDQARAPTYAPPAAAPPAPRDPWIGDLAFGYDASGAGAIPSGGRLPDRSSGSIYGFFSWRNVPPGSRIVVRVLWGGATQKEFEFSPQTPDGRTWVGIMSFDASAGGGATFSFSDVGLVFLLDGRELARGGAGLP
jgi:hypothetical protein